MIGENGEKSGCHREEIEHPDFDYNVVIDEYPNYINPTFEQVIMPDRSRRYKLCGSMGPAGYKITEDGVHRRYASKTRFGWYRITSAPAILSAISEKMDYDIHENVQITYIDGPGSVYTVWVDTARAFSPRIASFLRKRGAICTDNDGRRLADYFRECYLLRMQEARGYNE
ncbi:hypothetical protein RE474_01260 [Methanolobus sediminis]|uniref:Uncharacterized protein n=1 Tax=Methanolobus sediminis TaxID=3072978 RepID=A0AA51YMA1_9EURY|nr:hypothetical protein [Methanolobus sediminis]WMW25378.1 hypothetical protein RE474_01260 [Methanolobus sediminis]